MTDGVSPWSQFNAHRWSDLNARRQLTGFRKNGTHILDDETKRGSQMDPLPAKSFRIPYWDNLKGILIILVVLGHYLWEYREYQWIREAMYAIYIFHMPAFIFISGYFSRSKQSTSGEALAKLFVWFILLNFSMMGYALYIQHRPFSLLSLYYSSWYLLALFLYRLTLPLFRKIPFIVPISLLVSLCTGFLWVIDEVWELEKIISLYPFFIVGAKLTTERMEGLVALLKRYLWLSWGALLAVALLSLWLILQHTIGFNEVTWGAYKFNIGVAVRVVMLMLAGSMIVILLAITPTCRIPLVNKWGRNSLALYVTHRIFTLLLALFFPVLANHVLGWFWLAVACLITLLVLGSDTVSRIVNRALDYLAGAIVSRVLIRR